MFNCPRCHHLLGRMMGRGGNYWACELCGGHAINLSILRKVAQAPLINSIWQTAQNEKLFSPLKCPSCLKPMNVSRIFVGVEKLEVDGCLRCQFLWFDGSELASLPALPPPPPKKELPQKAREIIALAEVERIRNEAEAAERVSDDIDASWQTVAGLFGLPVEKDPPPLKRYPVVTWSIGLLVLLISAYAFSQGESFIRAFGFVPNEAFSSGWPGWFTSFFIHGGIFHLLSNLYFLYIFGDNVEDLIGRKRYLIVLVLSTLAGNLLHLMADPSADIPAVGASGGISGIITLYALVFPAARIGILFRHFLFLRWIHISARFALALWIFLQFYIAWRQLSGETNISALAHLGGCSIGFLYWLLILRAKIPKPPNLHEIE